MQHGGKLPKGPKIIKKHLFVGGITDSGKTTYALSLFHQVSGLRIFINTQYEENAEKMGIVCNSLKEITEEINRDTDRIIYNPPETGAMDEIEELRQILFKVGKLKMAGKERRHVWVHVFIDEVHTMGENLNLWVTQGKRWGITVIAIAQRPALTSHTILTQCETHVLFLCGLYETPYFEKYHIPIEEYEDHLKKPYHYIVVTPRGISTHPPIDIKGLF